MKWTATKPIAPGAYYVRGFEDGNPKKAALVEIRKRGSRPAEDDAREIVAWRSRKSDHPWCYSHGSTDPRVVHDHGGTYQPLCIATNAMHGEKE